jgi:hypothetical protein
MQVFSLDGTLHNEIPRIPSGMLQRFDSRHSPSHGDTTNVPQKSEEGPETRGRHAPGTNDQLVQYKAPIQHNDAGSWRPPAVTTSSPPSLSAGGRRDSEPQPLQRQHRRLSLKRLSRNADKGSGKSSKLGSSDDEDDQHVYPQREYATFGSVSHSLGSSPYDAAWRNNRYYSVDSPSTYSQEAARGKAFDGRRWHRASQLPWNFSSKGVWEGEQLQQVRPGVDGFRGRHRPKSFHGRGARRMEVVGEEEIEVELDGAEQIVSTQLADGSRPRFAEAEAHPLPQFGRPRLPTSAPAATTDWAFHEQTWRARRERVAAAALGGGARPAKRESRHGIPEVLVAGSKGAGDGEFESLMRRNSKSQPDLRGRAHISSQR